MKYFVLFLLMGCATTRVQNSGVRQIASEKGEGTTGIGSLIDAHIHMHFNRKTNDPYEVLIKQALSDLEARDVKGAVVHLGGEENGIFPYSLVGENLAVCAGVTPDAKYAVIEQKVREKKLRCLKIYLGYVPKWASDPFYKPYYNLALKHDIPIVFHTGDTYDKMASVKYADPLQIDEIAIKHPKLKLVIAHIGNPWIQSAAEVIYKNDNVYADVSALLLGDVSKEVSPEAVEELVVKPIHWLWLYVENPKKLMFGSDWPLLEIRPYAEAMARAIPKQHWRAFFYENAKEVFKLKVKE